MLSAKPPRNLEKRCATDVYDERAERERPGHPARDRTVDHKAQHRSDAADERDAQPHHGSRRGGHRRTRTRRTNLVARCTASSPSTMLATV